MFVENSEQVRSFFVNVHTKSQNGQILEPLEALVAGIIERHPEYHEVLGDLDKSMSQEYLDQHFDLNPFLHLGLHVALHEQIQADRPPGVRAEYHRHQIAGNDLHAMEHRMMDCLSNSLWQAQQSGMMPDEQAYIECLRRI